jgi:hypothetical protein
MPDLYAVWERWAADVTESHTTTRRWSGSTPTPPSSCNRAAGRADSAARSRRCHPKAPRYWPACACAAGSVFQLDLRAMASIFLMRLIRAGISLTYAEFLDAVARMREVAS